MKKQEANKQAPLLPKKTDKKKLLNYTHTHTHRCIYLNKHREKFGSI